MINNQTNTQKPELTKLIFESGHKNTIAVYESRFQGEPCYCIVHRPSGVYSVLDNDSDVVERVVEKIRSEGLTCTRKRGRWKFRFGKGGIYLDRFAYLRYTQQSTESAEIRINLLDSSLLQHGIVDLRSGNLFNGIGTRVNGERISVDILGGDRFDAEHIRVRMNDGLLEEIYDYSPELYTLLTYTHYSVYFPADCGRIYVRAGYKACKKTMPLSRMVGLYYTFFSEFDGDVQAFGRAIPLLPGGDVLEFDHINSCTNIGCRENLIPMEPRLNNVKNEWMKRFQLGGIDVFAIAHKNGRILCEYRLGHGLPLYRMFRRPEDLVDWMQFSQGRNLLTRNLRVASGEVGTPIHWQNIFVKRDGVILENMSFNVWYKRKETLLAMYEESPEEFLEYTANQYSSVETLATELMRVNRVPYVGIRIMPVGEAG